MAYGTIRRGSRGSTVKVAQQKLGVTADGVFGTKTEAAVKSFQSRNGLKADGIIGAQTWAALLKIKKPNPTVVGGSSGSSGSNGSSGVAMDTVINGPMNMVIGGVLLFGLYKVFMKIF